MTFAFVCVTCRGPGGDDDRPGRRMFYTLVAGLIDRTVAVRAVECLSVCKRPCTVALTAPGKRTYVVGDLDPASRVEDVIAMARRYGDSKDGIVAWRERPPCFCKAVVA